MREKNRIVPHAVVARASDDTSPEVWGFRDSGFHVDASGHIAFRGERYSISGSTMPRFRPWAERLLAIRLDPCDINRSHYPPSVPDRVENAKLEAALRMQLTAERMSTDSLLRLRHGHGHALADMWSIKYGRLKRIPDVVVWPVSTDEVQQVLELVREHGACVVPYGGGTNVTDALRCLDEERRAIVSLDLARMNRVLWLDPENHTAEIQAGATGAQITEQLGRHGFTLGHEPDSYELSTLGGWVATNASGMKKNRYGNIEDLLLSISAVTPAGTLSRLAWPRESVGTDPARWMIGSEGQLGIVTSAITKVFQLPDRRMFGSVLFPRFEDGFAFLRAVQESRCLPTSIRLVDNLQFQLGQVLQPTRSHLGALWHSIQKGIITGVRGFDPLQMVACTLLCEGTRQQVDAQQQVLRKLASVTRGVWAGPQHGKRGYDLTFAIAYMRDFLLEHWVLGESLETSVSWSGALELCAGVKRRVNLEHAKRQLPGTPFISSRVSHIYETGVCIYFYLAFSYKGVPSPCEVYAEIENAARDEILRYGGSLSHHHGIGKSRQAFMTRVFSPVALSMRRTLKQVIDPSHLLAGGNG